MIGSCRWTVRCRPAISASNSAARRNWTSSTQEGDAGLAFLRRLAERDEQVGEVVAEVAAVGRALERLDVDPGGDRAVGGDRDRERLQGAGGLPELARSSDAFGATWKSARRTMLPIRGPNASFFVISAVTVIQPLLGRGSRTPRGARSCRRRAGR